MKFMTSVLIIAKLTLIGTVLSAEIKETQPQSSSDRCQSPVLSSCLCGLNPIPVNVYVDSCPVDDKPEGYSCRPCPDACKPYVRCKTCYSRGCRTCEAGREGLFCEYRVVLTRGEVTTPESNSSSGKEEMFKLPNANDFANRNYHLGKFLHEINPHQLPNFGSGQMWLPSFMNGQRNLNYRSGQGMGPYFGYQQPIIPNIRMIRGIYQDRTKNEWMNSNSRKKLVRDLRRQQERDPNPVKGQEGNHDLKSEFWMALNAKNKQASVRDLESQKEADPHFGKAVEINQMLMSRQWMDPNFRRPRETIRDIGSQEELNPNLRKGQEVNKNQNREYWINPNFRFEQELIRDLLSQININTNFKREEEKNLRSGHWESANPRHEQDIIHYLRSLLEISPRFRIGQEINGNPKSEHWENPYFRLDGRVNPNPSREYWMNPNFRRKEWVNEEPINPNLRSDQKRNSDFMETILRQAPSYNLQPSAIHRKMPLPNSDYRSEQEEKPNLRSEEKADLSIFKEEPILNHKTERDIYADLDNQKTGEELRRKLELKFLRSQQEMIEKREEPELGQGKSEIDRDLRKEKGTMPDLKKEIEMSLNLNQQMETNRDRRSEEERNAYLRRGQGGDEDISEQWANPSLSDQNSNTDLRLEEMKRLYSQFHLANKHTQGNRNMQVNARVPNMGNGFYVDMMPRYFPYSYQGSREPEKQIFDFRHMQNPVYSGLGSKHLSLYSQKRFDGPPGNGNKTSSGGKTSFGDILADYKIDIEFVTELSPLNCENCTIAADIQLDSKDEKQMSINPEDQENQRGIFRHILNKIIGLLRNMSLNWRKFVSVGFNVTNTLSKEKFENKTTDAEKEQGDRNRTSHGSKPSKTVRLHQKKSVDKPEAKLEGRIHERGDAFKDSHQRKSKKQNLAEVGRGKSETGGKTEKQNAEVKTSENMTKTEEKITAGKEEEKEDVVHVEKSSKERNGSLENVGDASSSEEGVIEIKVHAIEEAGDISEEKGVSFERKIDISRKEGIPQKEKTSVTNESGGKGEDKLGKSKEITEIKADINENKPVTKEAARERGNGTTGDERQKDVKKYVFEKSSGSMEGTDGLRLVPSEATKSDVLKIDLRDEGARRFKEGNLDGREVVLVSKKRGERELKNTTYKYSSFERADILNQIKQRRENSSYQKHNEPTKQQLGRLEGSSLDRKSINQSKIPAIRHKRSAYTKNLTVQEGGTDHFFIGRRLLQVQIAEDDSNSLSSHHSRRRRMVSGAPVEDLCASKRNVKNGDLKCRTEKNKKVCSVICQQGFQINGNKSIEFDCPVKPILSALKESRRSRPCKPDMKQWKFSGSSSHRLSKRFAESDEDGVPQKSRSGSIKKKKCSKLGKKKSMRAGSKDRLNQKNGGK